MFISLRGGLLLTGINSIAFAPQFGFYEPWGTRYGLQLLLENTLSQPVRGKGSVHCSGSPIVISEFQLFSETQTWTMDNLLLARGRVSRGWLQWPVTRMTRDWPLARMTLYSLLPCCSLPTFCPHHHYPGDGKRGFSPRFH